MNILKKIVVLIICFLLVNISACKKPEGPGGTANIKGKVWVKQTRENELVVIGEYPGAYQDVYIIYGDNVVEGERVKANPDGDFEFRYLQPGKYKVYVYTNDSTTVSNENIPIIKEIEITKKKQTVDAGTFQIYTDKN